MRVLGSYFRFLDAVIALNVLVYIIGATGAAGWCGLGWVTCDYSLIPSLASSEPWRLITSMFVHAELWHLAMNMLAVYFFEMYMYNILGEKRTAAIYLLGGLAGSLMYMLFAYVGLFASMDAAVLGASGALFALGGALSVLRPNMKVTVFPLFIPMDLWKAEVLMLFMISPLFFAHVAWQGHLGGFVAGALLGYYYKKKTLEVPDIVQFTRVR